MILADTSVWIDHMRGRRSRFSAALENDLVLVHPFVIGELACGNLRDRNEVLALLQDLPLAVTATDAEVLAFIERRKLMGRGLGYIDVHLLASAALSGTARLWTHDRRLAAVAVQLGLAHDESS
jgi:predicted nucleic acid-binding protein